MWTKDTLMQFDSTCNILGDRRATPSTKCNRFHNTLLLSRLRYATALNYKEHLQETWLWDLFFTPNLYVVVGCRIGVHVEKSPIIPRRLFTIIYPCSFHIPSRSIDRTLNNERATTSLRSHHWRPSTLSEGSLFRNALWLSLTRVEFKKLVSKPIAPMCTIAKFCQVNTLQTFISETRHRIRHWNLSTTFAIQKCRRK